MFSKGFNKVAGFFDSAAKVIKGVKLPAPAMGGKVQSVAKPLATRLDGSKVTSQWGLRQGVNSGSVRYADIK